MAFFNNARSKNVKFGDLYYTYQVCYYTLLSYRFFVILNINKFGDA